MRSYNLLRGLCCSGAGVSDVEARERDAEARGTLGCKDVDCRENVGLEGAVLFDGFDSDLALAALVALAVLAALAMLPWELLLLLVMIFVSKARKAHAGMACGPANYFGWLRAGESWVSGAMPS